MKMSNCVRAVVRHPSRLEPEMLTVRNRVTFARLRGCKYQLQLASMRLLGSIPPARRGVAHVRAKAAANQAAAQGIRLKFLGSFPIASNCWLYRFLIARDVCRFGNRNLL